MRELNIYVSRIKDSLNGLWQKGAFHIMVGNFITKFVTFFGAVFLSRALSKSDLGILAYMENLCGYAYVFIGFGMSNAILRYGVLSKTIEEKKAFIRYTLCRGLIFDIFLVTLVLVVNIFYPHKENFDIARTLIPIMILALPFQDIINQILMNERAMFNNRRFAIFSLLSAAFIIIGRVTGAILENLMGVVIGIALVNAAIALYMGISSYKKYFKNVDNIKISKALKKESAIYSGQYMITNGLWGIFMLMDIFLLGQLLGSPDAVADYKIAFSFPVNMSIFSSAIGVFVAPYFVKHENDAIWIRSYYKKTIFATFGLMLAVALGLFILAKPLIWLYGKQYFNVIPLMRVLIISCFIDTAFRSTTANILAAIGKIKYNMIISLLGFICQFLLNLLMIPKFGAYGVAYTAIIIQSIMSFAVFIAFNNIYNIVSFRRKI